MLIIIILFIIGLIIDISNDEFGICLVFLVIGLLIALAFPMKISQKITTYNLLPLYDSSNYYVGLDKNESLFHCYIKYKVDSIDGYSYKEIHINDFNEEIYVKENFRAIEYKDVRAKSIINWFAIDLDFKTKYKLYIPEKCFDANFELR